MIDTDTALIYLTPLNWMTNPRWFYMMPGIKIYPAVGEKDVKTTIPDVMSHTCRRHPNTSYCRLMIDPVDLIKIFLIVEYYVNAYRRTQGQAHRYP